MPLSRVVFELPPTAATLTTMRFTAIFEPQAEGGYHAMCPTLPGCHSEGDTLDEAVINIWEAIAVYVECMIAHGFRFKPNSNKNISSASAGTPISLATSCMQ